MKKIFFLIIGICLILPLISAYDSHQQNTNLTVIFDEGNATSCNITYVEYPDGTSSNINQEFTKTGTTFTYLLNQDNFTQVGETCIGLTCKDPSATPAIEEGTICRYVTVSGSGDLSSGNGLILFGSMFVILCVSIFFFVLSMRFDTMFPKFFCIVLASIFLIITIFYSMVAVQQSLGGFSNIVEGYSTFFFVLKIITGIFITMFMIFALLISIRFYKLKRGWLD